MTSLISSINYPISDKNEAENDLILGLSGELRGRAIINEARINNKLKGFFYYLFGHALRVKSENGQIDYLNKKRVVYKIANGSDQRIDVVHRILCVNNSFFKPLNISKLGHIDLKCELSTKLFLSDKKINDLKNLKDLFQDFDNINNRLDLLNTYYSSQPNLYAKKKEDLIKNIQNLLENPFLSKEDPVHLKSLQDLLLSSENFNPESIKTQEYKNLEKYFTSRKETLKNILDENIRAITQNLMVRFQQPEWASSFTLDQFQILHQLYYLSVDDEFINVILDGFCSESMKKRLEVINQNLAQAVFTPMFTSNRINDIVEYLKKEIQLINLCSTIVNEIKIQDEKIKELGIDSEKSKQFYTTLGSTVNNRTSSLNIKKEYIKNKKIMSKLIKIGNLSKQLAG